MLICCFSKILKIACLKWEAFFSLNIDHVKPKASFDLIIEILNLHCWRLSKMSEWIKSGTARLVLMFIKFYDLEKDKQAYSIFFGL